MGSLAPIAEDLLFHLSALMLVDRCSLFCVFRFLVPFLISMC